MANPPITRHDGWTAERQAIFIAALRISRSVSRAAEAAGMSRKSAYALRRRPAGARFAAAWDHILRQGNEGYADLARSLAVAMTKGTGLASDKVTKVTPPGQLRHTVNLGQLAPGRIAPRLRFP